MNLLLWSLLILFVVPALIYVVAAVWNGSRAVWEGLCISDPRDVASIPPPIDEPALMAHDSVRDKVLNHCLTYDFANGDDTRRPIRVVRIVEEPNDVYDMLGFPRDYRLAHPMCGELIEMGTSRLVVDGQRWQSDDYYCSKTNEVNQK